MNPALPTSRSGVAQTLGSAGPVQLPLRRAELKLCANPRSYPLHLKRGPDFFGGPQPPGALHDSIDGPAHQFMST
jgi:hypothetical protein